MPTQTCQYPCAICRVSRDSLEALCGSCGWAPASLSETPVIRRVPTHAHAEVPHVSSNKIVGICTALVIVSAVTGFCIWKFWPELSSGLQIARSGSQKSGELSVSESQPVSAGTEVDIVEGNRVLVAKVKVTQVRWKVPGPLQSPKYPASGFVSVSLDSDQWKTVRAATEVSIRRSK